MRPFPLTREPCRHKCIALKRGRARSGSPTPQSANLPRHASLIARTREGAKTPPKPLRPLFEDRAKFVSFPDTHRRIRLGKLGHRRQRALVARRRNLAHTPRGGPSPRYTATAGSTMKRERPEQFALPPPSGRTARARGGEAHYHLRPLGGSPARISAAPKPGCHAPHANYLDTPA